MTIMIIDAGTLQEHLDHFTDCSFPYYFPSRVSCFLYISKSFAAWVFSISTNHTTIYPAACTNTNNMSFLIFFSAFTDIYPSYTGHNHRMLRLLQELNYLCPFFHFHPAIKLIFLKGKSHWITFFIGQCTDIPFLNNISPLLYYFHHYFYGFTFCFVLFC